MKSANIKTQIAQIISDVSETPIYELSDDTKIFCDLGMDSGDWTDLALSIESELGIGIDFQKFDDYAQNPVSLYRLTGQIADILARKAFRESWCEGMNITSPEIYDQATLGPSLKLDSQDIVDLELGLNKRLGHYISDGESFSETMTHGQVIAFLVERIQEENIICASPEEILDAERAKADIFNSVVAVAAETFGVDKNKINAQTRPIRDLDAQSIEVCEFLVNLRGKFNIDFSEDTIDATSDVGGAAMWVESVVLAQPS